MEKSIRVLVADDHDVVRAGLAEILGAESDISIVGEARNGLEAVSKALELRPDDFEVAEIFEVPLAFLLDPSNHQRNSVVHLGRQRHYYALPYGQYYIWGATAGMVMNFYSFLTA